MERKIIEINQIEYDRLRENSKLYLKSRYNNMLSWAKETEDYITKGLELHSKIHFEIYQDNLKELKRRDNGELTELELKELESRETDLGSKLRKLGARNF